MKSVVLLPLSQGKFAMIDSDDFEKVGHFKWYVMKTSSGDFYAARMVGKKPNRKTVYLHCELVGLKGVDHKNGNGLDCQRRNLRLATQQQNTRAFCRKPLGCSSRFRGVFWHKRDKKWVAHIQAGLGKRHLGYFDNEIEAARAFDTAAKKRNFFKEALNFPE